MEEGKKKKVSREITSELQSTATLAGAGVLGFSLLGSEFYRSARETIYLGRHAKRTMGEMILGTEGQRGVESLMDANSALAQRYAEEYKLVERLKETYDQNETFAREAQRLGVQLKGMIVNATAAGDSASNTVTGGLFRKIDDAIMDFVGNSKDAREALPKLQEIYESAREFYDGREKSEKTINELCLHLEKQGLQKIRENEDIRSDLDSLAVQLDETYQVENQFFDVEERTSFIKAVLGKEVKRLTGEDISGLETRVKEYRTGIDETRSSIEQNTGIGPYQEPLAWLEYGVNPVTFGIAAALMVKGASKFLGPAEKPFRYALTWPFRATVYAGKKAGGAALASVKGAASYAEGLIERYRAKKINSDDDSNNGEENGQESR